MVSCSSRLSGNYLCCDADVIIICQVLFGIVSKFPELIKSVLLMEPEWQFNSGPVFVELSI